MSCDQMGSIEIVRLHKNDCSGGWKDGCDLSVNGSSLTIKRFWNGLVPTVPRNSAQKRGNLSVTR